MLLDFALAVLATLHGLDACVLLFALAAGGGIGAPWSQDALLVAAGQVIAPAALSPGLVVLVAWLAVLGGDALSFWIGRHYGARWVRRPWAARFVPPQRLPGLEAGLRRIALPFAFATRFLPGQRSALFLIAGSLRMPWRAFLLGDGLAALVQAPLYFFGGASLGWNWQRSRDAFGLADNLLTLLLVLVLLAWWVRARRAPRG